MSTGEGKMLGAAFELLLSKLDRRPVLFDIGAAVAPPEVWQPIAPHSVYVGFDPDLREMQTRTDHPYHQAVIVNEAVTGDAGRSHAHFYFTKSPTCSSTLKPDAASLGEYLFADLFIVEREAGVRATTLDAVLDRLALPGVDWLKTDSQGTDLRLFEPQAGPAGTSPRAGPGTRPDRRVCGGRPLRRRAQTAPEERVLALQSGGAGDGQNEKLDAEAAQVHGAGSRF